MPATTTTTCAWGRCRHHSLSWVLWHSSHSSHCHGCEAADYGATRARQSCSCCLRDTGYRGEERGWGRGKRGPQGCRRQQQQLQTNNQNDGVRVNLGSEWRMELGNASGTADRSTHGHREERAVPRRQWRRRPRQIARSRFGHNDKTTHCQQNTHSCDRYKDVSVKRWVAAEERERERAKRGSRKQAQNNETRLQ